MPQIKKSFDNETVIKIGKGALISAAGAAALFILNAIGALQFQNPVLVSFVAWGVPFATNVIKEWLKGEVNQ